MDWVPLIIFLIALYAAIAYYIHSRKLWEDHITFYGPVMAIKTSRVGFFDKFAAFRRFFPALWIGRSNCSNHRIDFYYRYALYLSKVHPACPAGTHGDLQAPEYSSPARY